MSRPTISVGLKKEANRHGRHVVRLRITASRLSRYIALPVEVTPSQFNPKGKREAQNWIRTAHPNHGRYNHIIAQVWDQAIGAIDQLGPGATAEQLKQFLQTQAAPEEPAADAPQVPFFSDYARQYILRRGESSTTDSYLKALNTFFTFAGKPTVTYQDLRITYPKDPTGSISFEQLSMAYLKDWRAWLLKKYRKNTAWIYHMRVKTIAVEAVEEYPDQVICSVVADAFRRIKISKERTAKLRLYPDEIDRLAALELKEGSKLRQIRDMCLVMYYAHGMRVGDALRLRLSNYVVLQRTDGKLEHRLIYTMTKTKKPKNVLLPAVAVELLAPYRAACQQSTDTLFTFLRKKIDAGYSAYELSKKVKIAIANMHRRLKELATMAQIEKPLSAHVFRHSFADLARRNGLDVTQIQKALGHDQIATTQGYLEDLDQLSVDNVADLFNQPENNRKTLSGNSADLYTGPVKKAG